MSVRHFDFGSMLYSFFEKSKLNQGSKFIQRYFVGDILPLGVVFESFQPLKAFIVGLMYNREKQLLKRLHYHQFTLSDHSLWDN